MKARTQIIIVVGTLLVGTVFVLLMKQYKPMANYDGYKTVRELYFRPQSPTDRIVLQEKEEDGETLQRVVRITPQFLETSIVEVDLDTINKAVWKEIE